MFQSTSFFPKAHAFTSTWEGGFPNHPADQGGATNHGISLAFLQQGKIDSNGDGQINNLDVRGLSKEDAMLLYRKYFWGPMQCEKLPRPLALVLYDAGVNLGQGRASRLLQQGMNQAASSHAACAPLQVEEDGRIGPKSLALAEALDATRISTKAAVHAVEHRLTFYKNLCRQNSSQKVFYSGWRNRCSALIAEVLHLPGAGGEHPSPAQEFSEGDWA